MPGIMKLRVRIRDPINKTVVLELNADGKMPPNLDKLHEKAVNALLLPEELSQREASFISLNGADPLSDDDQQTLDALGIVNGDLVILVIKDCVLKEFRAQSFDHSKQTERKDDVSMGKSVEEMDTEENTATAGIAEEVSSVGLTSTDPVAPIEDEEHLDAAEVNQYLRKTMLIRDSSGKDDIPDSLRSDLDKSDLQNAHDVLFITLHVLMKETGFIPCHPLFRKDSSSSHWKSSGIYKIQYMYPDLQEATCELLGVPMAGVMLVYGSSKTTDVKRQLKVKVSNYVKLTSEGQEFSNLPKLSREFKDGISYALIQLCSKDTELALPSLTTIFLELKMLILQKLDVRSLLGLSQTCKGFNDLCKSPSLWYRLYLKRWGKHKVEGADLNKDWLKLYKERYQQMIAARRAILHARVVIPPYLNPPHPPLVRPPPWVPPMGIGGDYDRDPGFPLNPFRSGRVDPMQPRFDPINPLQPNFDPFRPAPDMLEDRRENRNSRGIHFGVPRPTFGGGGGGMHRFF